MATSSQSIREIVSNQSSAAAVLHKFEIDLCARGNDSLKQACDELQLSLEQVLEKLSDAAAKEQGAAAEDLSSYSLSRLIQHIVRSHHAYVRRELPRLAEMALKVADRHANRVPELQQVEWLLNELRAEMFAHLEKEEQILFPFIARMEEGTAGFAAPACSSFASVAQPVKVMMHEHDSAEALVAEMRRLTCDFVPPAWACTTFVAFCGGLKQFESNLRQHVHLENNILFPRAIALESEPIHRG